MQWGMRELCKLTMGFRVKVVPTSHVSNSTHKHPPQNISFPTVGEIPQPFGLVNDVCSHGSGRIDGIPPFFEFGTPVAKYLASRMVREKRTKDQGATQCPSSNMPATVHSPPSSPWVSRQCSWPPPSSPQAPPVSSPDRPTAHILQEENMFNSDNGHKLFAAAFSLALSALFFATAIVPASPNGLIA